MTLTSFLSISAQVDWNNDGSYAGTYDDVSADMRYPVSTKRGRASVNDQFAAGSGSFVLKNEDGLYTPFKSDSPIYPLVIAGRPVRVTVNYGGTNYPVFVGLCSPGSGRFESDGELSFSMVDAFERLRLGRTDTALQLSQRTDQLIGVILDEIGWPAAARLLDATGQVIDIFTNRGRTPLEALQLIARQDLGARLFIGTQGYVVFQSRLHGSIEPVFVTLNGTFDDLLPELRQEDLVDTVRGQPARINVAGTVTNVYELNPTGLPLDPGENTIEGTFSGIGAEDVIEPTTNTTSAYDTAILADSPVAYWKLNETAGANAADSSGHGRNLTYVGSPTLGVPGPLVGSSDGAMSLNGVNQYGERAFDAGLNPTTFSAEAWVNADPAGTATQRQVLVSVHNGGAGDVKGYFFEGFSTNTWNAVILNGTSFIFVQGPAIAHGEWTHLCMTYDGTTLRWYVNGVAAGSVAGTYVVNADTVLRVGAGTPSPVVPFFGAIARAAVYNTVLSSARVKAHYDAGRTADFAANASSDGTGQDKTAQLQLTSFAAKSAGFTAVFDNLDSSTIYLSRLNVRGLLISKLNSQSVFQADVASPVVTGQTMDEAFEFNSDSAAIRGWVNWQAVVRAGAPQPRLTLEITPDTDALMVAVLGADIGKRITITDTGAAWLTQLTGDYFIEAIELTFNGPASVTARWTLFAEALSGATAAAISSDLDAIARKLDFVGDFSTIAPDDLAVSGARIGF